MHRAKCDGSIGSKYFGCLPLNVISVKGLGAISFVVHLFEVILAVACFCFILTYNLTHRTYLVSAIWLEIGISSSIMIVSAILCFGSLVEVWLCIRSIATTIQMLLAAVIIGLVGIRSYKLSGCLQDIVQINSINSSLQFITSLKLRLQGRLPFVLELEKPTNWPELLKNRLRKTRLLKLARQEMKRFHLQSCLLINHLKSLMLTANLLKLAHLKVKRFNCLHSGLLINGLKSQLPK